MPPRLMLWVLGVIGFLVVHGETTRTVHRLVGGHMKIAGDLDDAELLITSSAGGGRDGKKKGGEDGEEKKTLSQQVADGKYGLIQKELFAKPVKKPGVLSYDSNPEVPVDNADNLGGLSKNDIWLAENHLLVIKGGAYPPHDSSSDLTHPVWSPIDDYKAPNRQVKLPAHPKVPPPFPVQLYEGGPLQILGTNSTTTLNGTFSAAPYPISSPEAGGFYPAFPPSGPYPANFTSGETPFPIPPYPPGDFGPPFPPFPLNGSLPPFFASLPPGAAILPPPGNLTDQYDEDDPSIYYPPPYSFYYQMDNSTQVPPGPLVPGIVLPPPPDFFAPLEKTRKKPSSTTTKAPKTRPTHRTTTTTESTKQIRPTTTPLPPTSVNKQRITPTDLSQKKSTTTQPPSTQRVVTIYPPRYVPKNRTYIPPRTQERRKKPPAVTVLRPVKPSTTTTQRPVYFYENNEVKPFKVYGPPSRHRTVISSTQIPLKAYFSTSNEIDTNSVTQAPETGYFNQRVIPQVQIPKTTKTPAQFYFYEEEPVTNRITTERAPKNRPEQQQYFNIPKEYYVPAKETNRPVYQQRPQKPPQPQQYYYVNQRPSRPPTSRYRFIETTKKPDTFSVHVARLKQQIHQYYTTPDPYGSYDNRPANPPKPVYQFSFQAANYQHPKNNNFRASPIDDQVGDKFRPNKYSVQIQPAIEVLPTERPVVYQNTPPPVYYEKSTTKRPEIKYYSSPQPEEYEYEEVEIGNQKDRYVATPSPISQYEFQATPNPVYQSYYTKQEEPFFDDITKKYFTVFGKKIPGVTTPISIVENTTPRPRIPQKNVQIEYAQSVGKEVSLQADTLVNYGPDHPRAQDPRAEYVRPRPEKYQHHQQEQEYIPEQASLHSDININYKNPRPPIHPDAEVVRAVPVKMLAQDNKPGSFISYELPGDNGAHFYFLTPQLAQRRDQGAGFYYENPSARS